MSQTNKNTHNQIPIVTYEYEVQKSILEQFNTSINQLMAEITTPYQELASYCSKMIDEILEPYNEIMSETLGQVANSISSILAESVYNNQELKKAINESFATIFQTMEGHSSEHYVELGTHTAQIIEERVIEIPDKFQVRVGSTTVRIRADLFFSILSIVISLIFGIITTTQGTENDPAAEQLSTQQLQCLEEQTALLSELLENVTSSDEETAETLRNIQQSLEIENSLSQESLEALDAIEGSLNNNFESDCTPAGIESEKNCRE